MGRSYIQINDEDGVDSTIISYRGTDDVDSAADLLTSTDVEFCWPLGIGNYRVAQGIMALEFYNPVAGHPADTHSPDIQFEKAGAKKVIKSFVETV